MRLPIVFTVLLSAVSSVALAERGDFRVTYVSIEHAYIDGGTEDGLAIGDRLGKIGPSGDTLSVEIVFAAAHSASCRLPDGERMEVGDVVFLLSRAVSAVRDDSEPSADTSRAPEKAAHPEEQVPTYIPSRAPTRVSGSFSLGYYHWADRSPANLSFSQTSARLTARVRHLWDERLSLAIRSRGRYDVRDHAIGAVDRDTWENRLWELTLEYDNPAGAISAAAGRLLPRRAPVIGYLDGALVEFRAAERWRIGLFGGQQPDWLYGVEGPSLTRAGGYAYFGPASRGGGSVRQTIGAVSERHGSRVSRSYLIAHGVIRPSGRLTFSHSLEVDVNSSWRYDRTGERMTLSRAYVHLGWQAARALRFGVSYDNLKRYWTFQYYSLADSLFDDRARQGWRIQSDWSPTAAWRFGAGAGWRDRPDGEQATVSYNFSMRRAGVIHRSASVLVALNGFDGAFEHGLNYSARLQALSPTVGLWTVGYGAYRYSVESVGETRSSWWLETGLDTDIARHYYLSGRAQYNSGDDIDGWRVQSELGYRF